MAATDVISEWVDAPPPAGSGDTVWNDRIDELMDNPGSWKKYGPYAAASITRSAKNAIERMGHGVNDFELTTRTVEVTNDNDEPVHDEDGEIVTEVWLFARYVGEE